MIDRNRAWTTSDNGVLLENGTHISSGTATPTHSGLKGDRYFKTGDASQWKLKADGTDWKEVNEQDGVVVDFYSTLETTIGISNVTLKLNTTRKSDAAFTLASDEVTCNTTRTYEVKYDASLKKEAGSKDVDFWLEVDGVEVPGTRSKAQNDGNSGASTAHGMAVLDLVSGEKVRIRSISDAASATSLIDGVRLIIHTPGTSGVAGPAGSASDFGTEFNEGESEGVSTTTSSSFQQKLKLTTSSLPLGKYILIYSMEFKTSANECEIQLEQNDATQLAEAKIDGSVPDQYQHFSGHKILTAISGVHNFDLDFRASLSSPTVSVQRARLTLWRIS